MATTKALLQVTPGSGIDGSTFGPNSYIITNTGTEVINQVVIDISKVLITKARFDTSGDAGDALATPLSLNSASDFNVITQVTYQLDNTISVSAKDGVPTTGTSDDNGFNRVILDLQGFDPGEFFAFQLDTDPLSIQAQPGAGNAGAVSGLELSGGTFTVKSATATASSMILADGTTNGGAAEALAVETSASPIAVNVAGISNGKSGFISDKALNQTVALSGPSNTAVRLLVIKGDQQAPAPAGSLGLFEANNVAEIVKRIDVTLDANGKATVPVTLSAGGPFSFLAGALSGGQVTGQTSAPALAVVGPVGVPVVLIEAESINTPPIGGTITGYRLESNTATSGGKMLSLIGGASGETGKATFAFKGATGNYNVILGTFDENDGQATLQVAKNGTSIGSVLLNQNLGSASATAATKVEKTVATGVSIANGDSFTITGFENAGEAARFDFIRFEPVSVLVGDPTLSIAATTQANEPSSNGLFTVSLSQAAATDTVVTYSVAGTATADTDYNKLSGTVTIPAGSLFASIPVQVKDDLVAEVPESVIVTLTGATGSDVVFGAKTATVTISDNDTKLSTLTFQAEAADSIVNYRTESIGAASGGKVLSLISVATNEKGSATFNFGDTPDELAGTYNIVVGTFDENDGVASFTVQLKDSETQTTNQIGSPLVLNANLGSGSANASTKVSKTVALGVSLTAGDSLIVNGFENAGEAARLDFIQLVPTI